MTEEQIKSLKIGDSFTLEFTVCQEDRDDAYMPIQGKLNDGTRMWASSLCLKDATLVKPAPTFEVGDTVRVIPDPMTGYVHGHGNRKSLEKGEVAKIIRPTAGGDAMIEAAEYKAWVSIHCLEMIKKAVKDRYKVEENDIAYCVMDGKWAIAHFAINSHPAAEAAAVAECDRLNAEWREQQEGKEGADHE